MSIFVDQKPEEISKNDSYTIQTPLKVMQILKIWKVWLKIWACHARLNFEFQMGVAGPIFEPDLPNFGKLFIFCRWTNDVITIFSFFYPKMRKFRKTDFLWLF